LREPLAAFRRRTRGRAVIDRREREPRLDHVGVEPIALSLELGDRHALEEILLPRERGLRESLHAANARPERLDSRRERRELLGPIVTRALHEVMPTLRLAKLTVEIAEALLLGPEPRLVIASQVPLEHALQEALLRPYLVGFGVARQ